MAPVAQMVRIEMEKDKISVKRYLLESVQDFLIKLDMKPCMYLVKISIFSLKNVTVKPTKIMNRADKN